MKNVFRVALLCILAFSAYGCGQPLVVVKGKVAQDGKPLLSYRQARVRIKFHLLNEADQPSGQIYVASIKRGGAFEVKGEKSRGIPPGKYRISVEIYDRNDNDRLNGAVGPDKSQIVREVTPEVGEVTIDIAKPTG